MTWKDFRRKFFLQYYPAMYRDQKRKEFLRLTQGKMIVVEYEATFTRLSKFTENFIKDEEEKCMLFLDGLNLVIQAKVDVQQCNSYAELVQLAMRVEGYENQFISRRQEKAKQSIPNVPFGAPRQRQFRRG